MKDSFRQPKPLVGLNPKMFLLDENKIKNIENRLMGPNNEGKAPSECQPLKESELENIKTKIILNGPLAPKEIKENINTINENNKNKNNIILKSNQGIKEINNSELKYDEKFLQKKRNSGEKNHKNSIEEDFLNSDVLKLEKNNSNKTILSDKSYKSDNNSGSELSPKHNNNGNTSNKYNKSIKDYYPTTFIARSNNNSNHLKNSNSCNISTHKKSIGERHNSNLIEGNETHITDKNNNNSELFNRAINEKDIRSKYNIRIKRKGDI